MASRVQQKQKQNNDDLNNSKNNTQNKLEIVKQALLSPSREKDPKEKSQPLNDLDLAQAKINIKSRIDA
jgi:hypothetical protein